MAYSQFSTIFKAKESFGFEIRERNFMDSVKPIEPIESLISLLNDSVPLVSLQSEKARSEGIIYPMLMESRRILHRRVTLFSGQDFTVDEAVGLNGVCDFLISDSPITVGIAAPVVVIVEAKKQDISLGLGQCAAEMVAAQRYNAAQNAADRPIYGIVTTGILWRFLRLHRVDDFNFLDIEPADRLLEPVSWMLGAICYTITDSP